MESVTKSQYSVQEYESNEIERSAAINEHLSSDLNQWFRPTTSVVIPAYNEEKGLPIVLEKLFNAVDDFCEVVVVDDGSRDKTSEVASRFPCKLIKHEVNKGKAAAMKTGISHSLGENVIFIDADGTYPVGAIPRMIEALKSCDAVYGSRANGRQNIPRFNRLGNTIFQNMMKYIYGFKASDYSTGLYGVKKHYLDMMEIKSGGFNIEVEIAIKASRMKLQVKEILVDYLPRLGTSKLCGWKVGVGHLKTMASHLAWHAPQHNTHIVSDSRNVPLVN